MCLLILFLLGFYAVYCYDLSSQGNFEMKIAVLILALYKNYYIIVIIKSDPSELIDM